MFHSFSAYDANDQIVKKKIEKQLKMFKKKAKVNLKDLKLLKFNLIVFTISIISLIAGSLMTYYLFIVNDGINANDKILNTDISDSQSASYFNSVGAHFGAVVLGIGIFLLIISVISFMNDYDCAKKRAIDALIEIEKQKNKKTKAGAISIFDALALGARMK